jgi:mannose-6-phosphate isomerase-like protein (cupin superfamily)
MLVVTSGSASARIGGKDITLEKGRTVLIPAGVAHEFWNEHGEPVEGILTMFGEGA